MIPPPRAKAEVRPFIDRLLACPELAEVEGAFGRDQAPERARFLSDLTLPRDEAEQRQVVLSAWSRVATPLHPADDENMTQSRLDRLRSLASEYWDFRQGAERDAIPTSTELLDPPTADAVYRLARAWGMLGASAVTGHFDHVIVLAGLIRANVNRPRAAAELLASRAVTTESVVGLAAVRAMSEGEVHLARQIGCDASSESEALAFGFEDAFGIDHGAWQTTSRDFVRSGRSSQGPALTLATAPLNPDGTRANTGGAFGWFISDDSHLVHPGTSLLSITTPIYWIASHTSLLTKLPADVSLSTTGADPADAAIALRQTFRSQHYLQEIKSALDAMADLERWAGQSITG